MKKELIHIKQLTRQLKQSEERYNKLWNQHKLLRLSYRSLQLKVLKNQPETCTGELNQELLKLLYGHRREQATLTFNGRSENTNS